MTYKLLKEKSPLVVNLTNYVTMNDIANILSVIGASPIMSKDIREASDLMDIVNAVGGALVINIGTIDKIQEDQILEFVKEANARDIRVILDPVGAGASEVRTNICLKLLTEYEISIVRGNFGEINSLMGSDELVKGVDSSENTNKDLAKEFSNKYNVAVLISGEDDYLATPLNDTPAQEYEFKGRGSSYLPKISGTGCMLTSIVAAYASIYDCRLEAMKHAIGHVLSASEMAEKESSSTTEFR